MTHEHKIPCIKCDSSDALHVFEGGDGYCFSCNTHFFPDELDPSIKAPVSPSKGTSPTPVLPKGKAANVPSRGLQEASLAHYGVTTIHNETNGDVESLIFPVYRKGEQVGTKQKDLASKRIFASGSTENPDFFGANKVGSGGKLLIITEGEEDCMSAYQMLKRQGKSYNVVSLPNGANVSAVKKRLEWLETFDTVMLNFDNDEVGKKAARQAADILTPGKAKIVSLPVKDANELLQLSGDHSKEYLTAIYNAPSYRPDGVLSLADSWDTMWEDSNIVSIPYPWVGINSKLYGIREREIVTLTAGTGIGKSAVIRELEHYLLKTTQDNIGVLALEESVGRTAWGIVAVEANLPLSIREERQGLTKEDVLPYFQNTIGTGRVFCLDHFGSTSETNLLSKVRYMVKGLGCKWIILDHLSIVVSAMDDLRDERKSIDSIMTRLRQLVEETGAGLFLVSHLRRIDGNRGHEQGVEVSLSHLRGSQSISQLSDAVIALERDQQAMDEKSANLTTLRILKNRYAGLTGIATHLAYERDTGRLVEILNVGEYLSPVEERGF